MKTLNITLLLLACACSIYAQNTTYYVSNTGNDSNDGSGWDNAFATLQHAEGVVGPGNTVLVANGSYDGVYVDINGTEEAPVTFKANGNEVYIISDNGSTPDGINVENASWIVIDGFNVNERTRAGIRVALSENITVRNNTCLNNGRWGIFTGFADDITIEYNHCAYSVDEHGIYHSNSADNPIIRYNTCHHNNANGIHMNGDASQGGDGLISNARVYGNIIYENGSAGGSGINCDGVTNSVFYNNLLYQNHASGISLYQIDGASGSVNNKVFNNTIINADDGRWCLNLMNASNGNTVYNNIFINQHTWRGAITLDETITSITSDYNLVTGSFTPDDAETVLDLEEWQAAGHDTHSIMAGNLADLFINPSSGDYLLKETSAAIDAGTEAVKDVVSVDLNKGPRPVNDFFDLGCYESGSVPSNGGAENPLAIKTKGPLITYENPMNPPYVINLSLSKASKVSLQITDVSGRFIDSLIDRDFESGLQVIQLDRTLLSPGMYFISGSIGIQNITAKRLLIR